MPNNFCKFIVFYRAVFLESFTDSRRLPLTEHCGKLSIRLGFFYQIEVEEEEEEWAEEEEDLQLTTKTYQKLGYTLSYSSHDMLFSHCKTKLRL